jgi:AbrB family looped-hinge helix DNA binding protein
VGKVVIRTVKLDEKGRILIPKELRNRAGIKNSVNVELEEGKIVIKASSLLDNLTKHPIGFTTKNLSRLRKAAHEQGLKEVRKDLEKKQ